MVISKGSIPAVVYVNPFLVPSLDEQLVSLEEDERETLYICPDAWALRHWFVNCEAGETMQARCVGQAGRCLDGWRSGTCPTG